MSGLLRTVLDKQAIEAFGRKWKISELSLFGSALRDDFRPDSDLDFLVEFEPGEEWDLIDLIHMQKELKEITGRDVDLVKRQVVETSPNRYRREGNSIARGAYLRAMSARTFKTS